MARPNKIGLDYFPFDVDFFDDIKIRKLIRRQGGKAVTVYALLLCFIYKNGYYIGSDEELPFIISEKTGYDEAYIQEVINNLFSLGLLDKTLYENHGIITSKGIQIRYLEVQKTTKRTGIIKEYNLVSSEITLVSSEISDISSEITLVSSEISTQRKEKKKKLNTPCNPPEGEGEAGKILNYYSFELPNDGANRNYKGLLDNLYRLRCDDSDIKQIIVLTNYGQIGNKVWKIFKQITPAINFPGKFIISKLNSND